MLVVSRNLDHEERGPPWNGLAERQQLAHVPAIANWNFAAYAAILGASMIGAQTRVFLSGSGSWRHRRNSCKVVRKGAIERLLSRDNP